MSILDQSPKDYANDLIRSMSLEDRRRVLDRLAVEKSTSAIMNRRYNQSLLAFVETRLQNVRRTNLEQ